jgi:pimeloyl-ACP methyl ester carboxylesterase
MLDPTDLPTADGAPAPTAWQARREWRMGLELASSALRTRNLHAWPRGDGHPVIVLPGFLAGPESTAFLRSHLRRLGYRAHDWRQGRNLGASPALAERLEDLLLELHDRYERRVSLIGWSAGGIYAREMARVLPGHTRSVITLGSPFRGHPASTRAWTMYRLMNRRNLERMFTQEALAQRAAPLLVPTTCIYSRTDGIVAWECCMSEPAPQTENIEVHATHLGYGHELETLRVIADRLAQPEGRWMPYARSAATASRARALAVAPVAPVVPVVPRTPLVGPDHDAGGEHRGRARRRAV